MPYVVAPLVSQAVPDSTLHAVSIGSMILSRFSYGIPVHLSDFSMGPGMGMVLTTAQGVARHGIDSYKNVSTRAGHSFLVDTSCTDYWADFQRESLQINITFPHQYLEELFLRCYGVPADKDFWQKKACFGGEKSSWLALLQYACSCISEHRDQVRQGPLGRHLEEMLGIQMLLEWVAQSGPPTAAFVGSLAPRYVKIAEEYIEAHAREAPTLSLIAQAAGVSIRTLSGSFRQFRGYTAIDFLRERRLQGIRKTLLSAPHETTVVSIANHWGYASMGGFAAKYFKRFGEYPSDTLNRLRSE